MTSLVTQRELPGQTTVQIAGRGDERRGDARGRPVRLRRVPDRAGRAAGRGVRGRRGDGDPGRAGDVRAAAAGLAGEPGRGRAARLGAVLRRDGHRQGPGRVRPGRPAGLRQLRVRRRHPRRARLDLRGVRDRDQDVVRHVPAALDHPLRGAGGRGAQHQGADLQRQERGPAVPRLRQQQAHPCPAGAVRQAGAAGGAVRQRAGVRAAAAGTTRRAPRTCPPATGRSARSTGRSPSSASRSCCRSCSPTPRTSAPSTRC